MSKTVVLKSKVLVPAPSALEAFHPVVNPVKTSLWSSLKVSDAIGFSLFSGGLSFPVGGITAAVLGLDGPAQVIIGGSTMIVTGVAAAIGVRRARFGDKLHAANLLNFEALKTWLAARYSLQLSSEQEKVVWDSIDSISAQNAVHLVLESKEGTDLVLKVDTTDEKLGLILGLEFAHSSTAEIANIDIASEPDVFVGEAVILSEALVKKMAIVSLNELAAEEQHIISRVQQDYAGLVRNMKQLQRLGGSLDVDEVVVTLSNLNSEVQTVIDVALDSVRKELKVQSEWVSSRGLKPESGLMIEPVKPVVGVSQQARLPLTDLVSNK
jgi:hypothetical protein